MFGWIKSLITGGGVGAISGAVKDVAEVFTENSENEAQRSHDRGMAKDSQGHAVKMAGMDFQASSLSGAHSSFVAEWGASAQKGDIFNAFADFLNRLPRPFMAVGVIGIFAYAMIDPVGATASFMALSTIPIEMWAILSAVVSFYFVAREFTKSREKRLTPQEAVAYAEQVASLRSSRAVEEVRREVDGKRERNPTIAKWIDDNT